MISSLEKLFSGGRKISDFELWEPLELVKAAEDYLHLLSDDKCQWLSLRPFALAAIGFSESLRPGTEENRNGIS
jgi:hypothetical protein